MECFTNNRIEKLYKRKSYLITVLKRLHRNNSTNEHNIITIKAEIKRINELISQNIKIEVNRFYQDRLQKLKKGNKLFPKIKQIINTSTYRKIDKLELDENTMSCIDSININTENLTEENNKVFCNDVNDNLNVLGCIIEKNSRLRDASDRSRHEEIVKHYALAIKEKQKHQLENNLAKVFFANNNLANMPSILPEYFITIEELQQTLKVANNKKSFGTDKIPNIVLKHLPICIVEELCALFNHLLNIRSFPKCWKIAKIVPILKKNKNPLDPLNYRPISLLSNLGKIYEIIIHNRIQKHVTENKIIPDNQFGFRHQHSTTHAIANLTSHICYNLNNNQATGAVLIDLEKAFESVWLDGLLFKLKKLKFDEDLILIIADLLFNRKFIITQKNYTSSHTFSISNGLQQGSITAPLLFNIYIADLLKNEKLNNELKTIAYADDIIIFCAGKKVSLIKKKLQTGINFLTDFLYTWRIKISTQKCESILFRKPTTNSNSNITRNWKKLIIKINNTDIIPKTIVKYLGVNLDNLLYMHKHIKIQLEKARKAFMSHKRIFFSKHVSPEVKIMSYEALVRPILTYACPVWFNISDSIMETLRKFERKCIRHCNGQFRKAETQFKHYISNEWQYNTYSKERIDIFIINLIRKHIDNTTKERDNSLKYGLYYTDWSVLNNYIQQNQMPGPEAFILLDNIGYIQHTNGTPLIYHVRRKLNEKFFLFEKFENPSQNTRYSTAQKNFDRIQHHSDMKKYWWKNGIEF